jgi:hypothetical protein
MFSADPGLETALFLWNLLELRQRDVRRHLLEEMQNESLTFESMGKSADDYAALAVYWHNKEVVRCLENLRQTTGRDRNKSAVIILEELAFAGTTIDSIPGITDKEVELLSKLEAKRTEQQIAA